MAQRPQRRNPQPPNRNRSRKPGQGQLSLFDSPGSQPSRAGLAYDRFVLGGERVPPVPPVAPTPRASKAAEGGTHTPAKARANREMGYETAMAMQEARAGEDSGLLPYQPTPSINPPRPRTLAAGYDPKTQTLRVRFRDGTPWAYYNVPPEVWRNFKRVKSPGRYINRKLNQFEYSRDNF